MKLAQLLAEADAMGLGLISWRPAADDCRCFAANTGTPCVAVGATGVEALAELVRFARVLR